VPKQALIPVVFALIFAACLASCASPAVRAECREKVNSCLAGCGAGSPSARNQRVDGGFSPFGAVDDRSMCERQCHDLCIGTMPR